MTILCDSKFPEFPLGISYMLLKLLRVVSIIAVPKAQERLCLSNKRSNVLLGWGF